MHPLVFGLGGHRRWPTSCISRNPLLPVRLAESFGGLYRFLLNKWYFDELYDCDLRAAGVPLGPPVLAGW